MNLTKNIDYFDQIRSITKKKSKTTVNFDQKSSLRDYRRDNHFFFSPIGDSFYRRLKLSKLQCSQT